MRLSDKSIIENMSIHICSECGHAEHIFGTGGGEKMSEDYDIDFLGALPLDINIRQNVDEGKPNVAIDADSQVSMIYREIARRTGAKISLQGKEFKASFPNIVIQNT